MKDSTKDNLHKIAAYGLPTLLIFFCVLGLFLSYSNSYSDHAADGFIYGAIVLAVFNITYLQKVNQVNNHVKPLKDEKKIVIKEETVFKIQSDFEDKITNEIGLPDAIPGYEIFIYKNLMRPWFNELIAKHRYDEKMTQELRNDWIDYINAICDRTTYHYLSLESEDEKDSEEYTEDHITASRKVFSIQDAFAAAIGPAAVSELKRTKEISFSRFNIYGDLAPDGFRWEWGGQGEELIPIKQLNL